MGKDTFLLQESYGKGWGQFGNGTWETPTDDRCGEAILQKAYFTAIFYDYDRANAYYEEVDVMESQLKYVEYKPSLHFSEGDLTNIGKAKNRCAFLGVDCKGVFENSDGELKLVSSVSGKKKKKDDSKTKYFRKRQMVIYLELDVDGTKNYLRIRVHKKGSLKLEMTNSKTKAAPFFTSYGRI